MKTGEPSREPHEPDPIEARLDRLLSQPPPAIADGNFSAQIVARLRAAPDRTMAGPGWLETWLGVVPWRALFAAVATATLLASDLTWPADAAQMLFVGTCGVLMLAPEILPGLLRSARRLTTR